MLVYSTILDIAESLTKEVFINLVIKWNQESPHSDSVIPDLHWNGERNIRYGNDDLWLSIEEYRNKNIIAIRYEKKATDGAVWDTDFIMNFTEMRMAIQLDRSYIGEIYTLGKTHSTPYFLTLLIEGGYLKDDNGIPVFGDPITIRNDNISLLTNLINGNSHYALPVVYVSKTYFDEDPLDIWKLAKLLRGAAHIFVQEGTFQNPTLQCKCNEKNEYHGAIGVYFTNSPAMNQRFLYRDYCHGNALLYKVIRCVMQRATCQKVDFLYTWQGVQNSLLRDRLATQKNEKLKAEKTADEYAAFFDGELNYWKQKVTDLTRANDALTAENQGLHNKIANSGFSHVLNINIGAEDDFYPEEIKDIILAVLEKSLSEIEPQSRRYDIVTNILRSNKHHSIREKKIEQLKHALKSSSKMTPHILQELKDIGFEISEDGKHYKLTYFGDARYTIALAKTPSDYRSGQNNISIITKTVF